MIGHNICFKGVISKIIPKLSILSLLIWSSELLVSSPGQSPGRAIVLPPASALALAAGLAKSLTLKFLM